MIINKLFRYLRSIRFFIAMLLIVVGTIPMLLISDMALKLYLQVEVNSRISAIQNSCVSMADRLESNHYLLEQQTSLTEQLNLLADTYEGRIQVIDGNYKIVADTYGITEGKYCISKEVFQAFEGKNYSVSNQKEHYIEYISTISDAKEKQVSGVIVFTASTNTLAHRYEMMRERMKSVHIVMEILLVVLAFVIAEVFERPFHRLVDTLAKINRGDPSAKIINKGYTEIKDINNGYSGAMKQLRDLDQSRQEFVSNVSHELKTPITSVKVLVDTLLMSEHVEEEVYRDFLQDISNEVNRETDIINDLLSLVRLDKSSNELNIKQVNINDFVEDILYRLKPIASERNIEITYETFRPITAEIDEVKLSLAIMNIVENAIKYNNDHGFVKVSLNADHKYFYVDVQDSGVGIPEDAREKIFERFYRVDKARSRETGGTGLGLAITKQIVVMHGGDISVSAPPSGGSQFVISVPMTRAAAK